jgi:co-chaperonin GroES (HSP10)
MTDKLKDIDDVKEDGVSTSLEEISQAVSSMYKPREERVFDPNSVDGSLLERMPTPTGWRMLILPYRGKGVTDGGIVLPGKMLDDGQLQTVVGYVLKVGPLAYKDQEKFPDGPWCKQGDWVIFARYAGSRFRIEGGEVRVLNDDEILATISDPEDIISL